MSVRWILTGLMCVAATAQADDCKYERQLDENLPLRGASSLAVIARAGQLEITGVAGIKNAEINGRACASNKAWLDEINLFAEQGDSATIEALVPDVHSEGWNWNDRYAYLDLTIRVPATLALEVRDSSGDIRMENVGSLDLTDSSGEVVIEGTNGAVSIRDSSGDLELSDIGGSLEIQDSSGEIEVAGVDGDFTVLADSSGSIFAERISGEARIVRDGSGDIRLANVARDAIVERDSSGGIMVNDVEGDFVVGRDGGGGIKYRDVSGQIDIPNQ